jgi:hypothetical protein
MHPAHGHIFYRLGLQRWRGSRRDQRHFDAWLVERSYQQIAPVLGQCS